MEVLSKEALINDIKEIFDLSDDVTLSPNTDLFNSESISIDSLEFLDLMIQIEEKYGVKYEESITIRTIEDLILYASIDEEN